MSCVRGLLPQVFTTVRLLLAPPVLVLAWNGRTGWLLLSCLIVGFVSDYLDGIAARQLRVKSGKGSYYDTVVDVIFYSAALLAIWFVHPQIVRRHALGVTIIVALALLRVTLDFWKFGRPSSYHMWSMKAWAAALFVMLIALLGFGFGGWLFTFAMVLGILANLEGALVSLALHEMRPNVPTLLHALRQPQTET